MKTLRHIALSCLFLSSLLLSGCGFHLRSGKNIPVALRTLYFNSTNPYDESSVALKQTLQSLGVNVVNAPSKARYGLYFMGSNLTHTQPSISNTNQSTSVSFTLKTQLKIVRRDGETLIGPLAFSASTNQTLNADQIYTTTIDSGAKQQLQQKVISSIYYWLTSDEMKQALKQTHANKHKTIKQHAQ